MANETIGTVQRVKHHDDLSNGGERFGLLVTGEDDDEDKWHNGWGSPPEVEQGDKVKVPWDMEEYKGDLRREVPDKDDVQVLESNNGSSSPSPGPSPSHPAESSNPRAEAVQAVGQAMDIEDPDGKQLQTVKLLVEEFTYFIENGEWDSLEDTIVRMLSDNDESGKKGVPDDVAEGLKEKSEEIDDSEDVLFGEDENDEDE